MSESEDESGRLATEVYRGWNSTRFWAAMGLGAGTMAAMVYHIAVTDGLAGFEGTVLGGAGLVQLAIFGICAITVSSRVASEVTSRVA